MIAELPTSGQFVAIWFVNDQPFCATLKWEDNQLKQYNEEYDEFLCECDHGVHTSFLNSVNAECVVGKL